MAKFDSSEFDRQVLQSNGIEVAFGVPDSSLSGLLSFFSTTKSTKQHIVVANEGAAVALAVGYYFARRKPALVYVQNSGFSNALNPLQSIASKEVFGIPMLLMIGWRGKPGEKDEPQHALVGPRLLDNLRANNLPFEEVPNTLGGARDSVSRLLAIAGRKQSPVALVVPRNTFTEYRPDETTTTTDIGSEAVCAPLVRATRWLSPIEAAELPLSREQVIRHCLDFVGEQDSTVTSLGGNSRELYMIRKEQNQSIGQNFFCIGGMGHSFALAHGLAVGCRQRHRIWCLDGDGSFIMHLGNNAVLSGLHDTQDVIHVVIFNGVYSSTGSQPLMVDLDQFLNLAEGLPYRRKMFVDSILGLRTALASVAGGTLIVVATNDRMSDNLPRPKETSAELKNLFLEHVDSVPKMHANGVHVVANGVA